MWWFLQFLLLQNKELFPHNHYIYWKISLYPKFCHLKAPTFVIQHDLCISSLYSDCVQNCLYPTILNYLIRMSYWHWRMSVDGAEFWIRCKPPAFLSSFSCLQVIQRHLQVIPFEIDCVISYTNLHELFCQFICWTN